MEMEHIFFPFFFSVLSYLILGFFLASLLGKEKGYKKGVKNGFGWVLSLPFVVTWAVVKNIYYLINPTAKKTKKKKNRRDEDDD
jgi:hypothetical protein